MNPTDGDVRVRVDGRDDSGAPPPQRIAFTLAAGAARTITAEELEHGGSGFAGAFGDGVGKWQLFVTAGSRVVVMSLLESPHRPPDEPVPQRCERRCGDSALPVGVGVGSGRIRAGDQPLR